MYMTKQLGQHSEEGFIRGFSRYYISEMIIETETWEDLTTELINFEHKGDLKSCYDEYRIFNIALVLQQKLCEVVGMAYKANHIKDPTSLNNYVLKIATLNLGKDAKKILETETSNSETGIYTPHGLPYVAGLTLGQIIKLFTDFVAVPNKDTLDIKNDLLKFNTKRNELMHNLFSSRIKSLELQETINLGKGLIRELDEIHSEYLFPST
jgi:hypothetical protein